MASVKIENELDPTLVGVASLNFAARHNSSSRQVMFTASHIGQALTLIDPKPNRVQTGVEREFGKYTFNVKVKKDSVVVKVIPKYRQRIGANSIKENPSSLLILECETTGEVDMLDLPYHSNGSVIKHQQFGFKYIGKPELSKLIPGGRVEKDTILLDSPNVKEGGTYCFGRDVNVAYMSLPGIIEDGFIVSESFCKKFAIRKYERRTASWGKNFYPLNLYGDENNYKPFPDIGDTIRPDGLLFALREYDPLLGGLEMNKIALTTVDYTFDKLYYAQPNAKVVDMDIEHSLVDNPPTPMGMEVQTQKYYDALFKFHQEVVDVYDELLMQRGKNLKLSSAFHKQLVTSMAFIGMKNVKATDTLPNRKQLKKRKVNKTRRCEPIDDWHVTIQTEYMEFPTRTYKITNMHGGKGVICSVLPDDQMPIDADGNHAEVIMDPLTVIKRMNIGAPYEQHLKACMRDLTKELRDRAQQGESKAVLIDRLLGFYDIVNPKMVELLKSPNYKGTLEGHLDKVLADGIYLWMPVDNEEDSIAICNELKANYPLCFGPVMYKGKLTRAPVLIGPAYILLLEKTGSDWSGVDSAKLQHFGLPAKITNADKHGNPGRNNPIRNFGETEVRALTSILGNDAVVYMMNLSTSPVAHKEHLRNLMSADKPTDIEEAVDPAKIPAGGNRALMFVRHILECSGIHFTRGK